MSSAATIEDLAVRLAEHRVVEGVEAPLVGRYQLIKDLGAGSFGRVFRAHDHLFGRDVALKLTAARDDERDMREPRSLAVVDHDNVVKVYDVGVEGSYRWMAMELVEGVNLRQWVKQKRSASELLAVLRQVGEGLAAIHAKGIAHRDIKPENIMVSSSGRAKLIDLGLAKEEGAIGTPRWAAPEVREREPDQLSDQYSFALVCQWALERIGAGRLAHKFCTRALKPDPSERWRSLAEGLRFMPHYHRWRWRALALAVLIGVLAGAGAMRWWSGGAEASAVPSWVEPLAEMAKARDLAAAGRIQGAYDVVIKTRAELLEHDPRFAAMAMAVVADNLQDAKTPSEKFWAAMVTVAASEAVESAGDERKADEYRLRAAELFDGFDDVAAERLRAKVR